MYRDFTMSDKKEKLERENIEFDENMLNGDSADKVESDESETDESIGTPSYEELFDKNEELEKLLLRSNADLDNALKRTLSEVEKAHKYGTEKLLLELLPIIDNLENALSNLSENITKEDKEGIELTLKSFESTLDKFGMIPIYPLNEELSLIHI